MSKSGRIPSCISLAQYPLHHTPAGIVAQAQEGCQTISETQRRKGSKERKVLRGLPTTDYLPNPVCSSCFLTTNSNALKPLRSLLPLQIGRASCRERV